MKKTIATIFLMAVVQCIAMAQVQMPDSLGFDRIAATSPAQLAEGRVSGVNVTTAVYKGNPLGADEIDIRGINTLHGDNQPLYIIDGVELGYDFSRTMSPFWNYDGFSSVEALNPLFGLNSYDISSIEVLKDVSATAVYGSRGANGVVIIKTIHRNSGNNVTFNVNTGMLVTGSKVDGVVNNHNIGIAGSVKRSYYNVSANVSNILSQSSSRESLQGGLKANLGSSYKEYVDFGANVVASMGSFANNGNSIPDYYDEGKRYSVQGSAFIDVNFTKWLSLKTEGGVDFRRIDRNFWYGNDSAVGAAYNGLGSIDSHACFAANVGTRLNFHRYFATRHYLSLDLGFEYRHQNSTMNTMSGDDFFTHQYRADVIKIANGAKQLHLYSPKWSGMGFFADLKYSLLNIAGADVVFRADNNSRFDDNSYTMYPAASAWIDFAKMFVPDSKAVSSLRVEGGWGISGNEQQSPYVYMPDYIACGYPVIDVDAEPYYEGLFRLRTTEWTVGATLGFLSDRISLGAKYFDRKNEDMFNVYTFGSIVDGKWKYTDRENIQSRLDGIRNCGIEADVNLVPVSTKNVKWNVSVNFTYNENQVTALNYNDTRVEAGDSYYANILGKSVAGIWGYNVKDGYYEDVTRDGRINDADKVVLGGTVPRWFGGASTTLRLWRFTIDALASWATDMYVVDYPLMAQEGKTKLTGRYISRGDYLRLARVSLRYDIPLRSKVVSGLAVNVTGNNLLIATSVRDGWQFGQSPLQRMVILGVNLKF